MGKLYDTLMKDYRLREGLNACINCGTCTAVCPAAEFYRYDPRRIVYRAVTTRKSRNSSKAIPSGTAANA